MLNAINLIPEIVTITVLGHLRDRRQISLLIQKNVTTTPEVIRKPALREKCPNTEFFWSVFSRIRTEYGEISISP